ncbi:MULTISPECIES: ATP-binding protein [Acinetobacter]|uniref:ATP-binding protein n=1 Tax=Acinetobacter TaxID=469 RepID=UPI001330791E|nr:ATP-binding protein [Acinetobacter johnsonii]MDH1240310.1 ATP-binding protein [Acinetobacter johnsonii]MDH1725398.1 ATP-binding protein [Acinetobacter johnsonii]
MSNKVTYNVYYENEHGNTLINTLTENQKEALYNYLEGKIKEINFKNSKVKLVRNDNLIVLIIATSHKIQVSKQNLENYYSLVSDVVSNIDDSIQKVKDDTRRILHNVVSLNSINNQEFDSIFTPEEIEGLSHKKMIAHMSTKIKGHSNTVAKSILKINKNSNEIKYELDVFKYLINPNSVLRKSRQNIHRVTKRILDTFFLDFLDKGITVNLSTQDDKLIECDLNFDCLRYAIYNNFDNALKYCKPESEVDVYISIEEGKILIEFNMISLKINKNEVNKIFIEGYCGDSAKQIQLNGDGIGLYMTKRILDRINSTITLYQREEYSYNSIQYQRNIFTIHINLDEK